MHARQTNGELARKTLNCQMNAHDNCGGYVPGGQSDRVTCLCGCHSLTTAAPTMTVNCDQEEALTILVGRLREARRTIATMRTDLASWERETTQLELDIAELKGQLD